MLRRIIAIFSGHLTLSKPDLPGTDGVSFNVKLDKDFVDKDQEKVVDYKFNPAFIKYLLDRTADDNLLVGEIIKQHVQKLSLESINQGISFITYHNGEEYRYIRLGHDDEDEIIWNDHFDKVRNRLSQIKGNVVRIDTVFELQGIQVGDGSVEFECIGVVTDSPFRKQFGARIRIKDNPQSVFTYDPVLSNWIFPRIKSFLDNTFILYKELNPN